jgi:hypothetical protein
MSDDAHILPLFPEPTFWNPSAGDWDEEFRAWAEPLLKLSAEHAGIAMIVIGQLIECAWRLRRINTTLAADANLTRRDWCRARDEAQRAFARAQTDYQRWVCETERARERRGGVRGAAGTRRGASGPVPDTSALATPATPPPIPVPKWSEAKPQAASHSSVTSKPSDPGASTHTNNIVANGVPQSPLDASNVVGRNGKGRRQHLRALKRLRG